MGKKVDIILIFVLKLLQFQKIISYNQEIKTFTDDFYENDYLEAPIASGSFKTMGMLIMPCSMKTLSAIAN